MVPLSIFGIIASIITLYMGVRLAMNTPAVGAGMVFCFLACYFFVFSLWVLLNSKKTRKSTT